jgi:hypothetical protein
MKLRNVTLVLIFFMTLTGCFSAKGLPIKEVKDDTQQTIETHPEEEEKTTIEKDIKINVTAEDVQIDKQIDEPKVENSEWDKLLKKYVSDNGDVNYKGFKKDIKTLNDYVNYLATQIPSESWTINEQLAYFINVYNANTIKLITDNYPTKSIKDIKNPWLKDRIKIGDKDFSLADVENGILRKMNEPRIHFAINCASFSCPKLLNIAYTETNVQELMEQATHEFINNTSKNKLAKDELKISEIFKWYKSDFTENGSVIDYINQYSEIKIFPNAKIDYINYNWSLNEQN